MKKIWALADLHLSFGVPDKAMDIFGAQWVNHASKIAHNWKKAISEEDLILIPGDISWAMRLEDAVPDLEWIHALPGTKMMIRGNHDFWWHSLSKIGKILPSSIKLIQNNTLHWHHVGIAGARLWDTSEYGFNGCVNFSPNPKTKVLTETDANFEEADRIYQREISRLETSLKGFTPQDTLRIVMTHYPPIGADLKESMVSKLLEKHKVNDCVFGHLHNARHDVKLFGTKNGLEYRLTAADYLNFEPQLLYTIKVK